VKPFDAIVDLVDLARRIRHGTPATRSGGQIAIADGSATGRIQSSGRNSTDYVSLRAAAYAEEKRKRRTIMPDGKRKRRFSANPAQREWYARWRQLRFARRFGFVAA